MNESERDGGEGEGDSDGDNWHGDDGSGNSGEADALVRLPATDTDDGDDDGVGDTDADAASGNGDVDGDVGDEPSQVQVLLGPANSCECASSKRLMAPLTPSPSLSRLLPAPVCVPVVLVPVMLLALLSR